jgi:hypothetical protein
MVCYLNYQKTEAMLHDSKRKKSRQNWILLFSNYSVSIGTDCSSGLMIIFWGIRSKNNLVAYLLVNKVQLNTPSVFQ